MTKAKILIEKLRKTKKLGEAVYWQLVVKNQLLSIIKQLRREESDENAVKVIDKLQDLANEMDELYQKLIDPEQQEKKDE